MGIFDSALSDPQTQAALLGMTQAFARDAQTTRAPMGFGQVLGDAGAGALQGRLVDYPQQQLARQNMQMGQLNLAQRQNMLNAIQGMNGQTAPMGFPVNPQAAAAMPAAPGAQQPSGSAPMGVPQQASGGLWDLKPPGWSDNEWSMALKINPEEAIKAGIDARKPQNLRANSNLVVGNKSVYQAPPSSSEANRAPTTRIIEQNGQRISQQFNPQTMGWDEVGRTPLPPVLSVQDQINLAGAKRGAEINAEQAAISPNDPAVQSYKDQVLNGTVDARNIPTAYRTHVVNALEADSKQAEAEQKDPRLPPIASQRLSNVANSVSEGYRTSAPYKLAADGLPYLLRIQAAASQKPSALTDADMLDALTKMNTGGNAITDAQVGLVTNYRSYGDMLNVLKNKIVAQGGSLSDSQRKDVVNLSNALYDNYQKGYQPMYQELTDKLRARHIPESLWPVPNFGKLAQQTRAAMAAPQQAQPQSPQQPTQFPAPPQKSIQYLRMNPGTAATFEAHYGPGSAKQYLER